MMSLLGWAGGLALTNMDALRADVDVLEQAGIAAMPASTWPLPVAELQELVRRANEATAQTPATLVSLARLQRALKISGTRDDDSVTIAGVLHPTRFRREDSQPREDGELGLTLVRSNENWTGQLAAAIAASPEDGQTFRFDNSYVSRRAGNWLLSAGFVPRVWGPSHQDSLILSSNARPVPAVAIDRILASAPQSRWLHWIGPWRFSMFLGGLEHARSDIKSPLFAGARITLRPLRGVELGLTRTSQFCGDGRPCDWNTFRHLLLGRTNTDLSGINAANDPGNDMAGFDVRLTSPFRWLPVALYGQLIGEDQKGGVPFKYLGQVGAEWWHHFDDGAAATVVVEHVATSCSFYRTQPFYGCAYRQTLFNADGYRYKGRILGSAFEADATVTTLEFRLIDANGDRFALHVRSGELNKGGANAFNVAAPTRRKLRGVDLEYRAVRPWGELTTGFGVDRLRATNATTEVNTPRFYLSLRRAVPW